MISPTQIDALFGLKVVNYALLEQFMRQYWSLKPSDLIDIRVMSGEDAHLASDTPLRPQDCVRVIVYRKYEVFMFRHSLVKAFLMNIENLSINNAGVGENPLGCPVCKQILAV